MRPRAIHQFYAGSASDDRVAQAMFFIQTILRGAGYSSDIHCVRVAPSLAGRVLPHTAATDNLDDLLLVHYSPGSEHDDWVTSRSARKILVYHSIISAELLPGASALARWAHDGTFAGAIVDSASHAGALTALGFPSVAVMGPFVDLDRVRADPWSAGPAAEPTGALALLSVGGAARHETQLDLVRMLANLTALSRRPVHLVLAGAVDTDDEHAQILCMIDRLGMSNHVRVLDHPGDADILALYRAADLFVSASLHEGFAMALVEAMALDIPVLTWAAGGVADPSWQGGLVLDHATPERLAAAAHLMLTEPGLRRRVIQGQRAALARLERPTLTRGLEAYLRRIAIDVRLQATFPAAPSPQRWTVEGPFDSSYSLAIVNSELARALSRPHVGADISVSLISRDGPGAYEPDMLFLAANPDLAAMVARVRAGGAAAVCLRNQFPPDVSGMRGAMRVLANYAWEESGFPRDWVDNCNAGLDLVTVTSGYVAKVLRDNGVRVPIAVVGNGIDHTGRDGRAGAASTGQGPFRFLHISSGFPRKGIDALLDAWGAAFTHADPVELVIKTFPNVHNVTADQIEAHRAAWPGGAPVIHIDNDIAPAALAALYDSADAVVGPSRGEGFGLPLAEAMARGLPVITTAFGGQTEFCTPETAWLCDYSFAYAQTHLGVFDSVWVEPDIADLAILLRAVWEAPAEQRARRAEAGRDIVRARFRWDEVAARTRAAVRTVWDDSAADGLRQPSIGLVSTWNATCPIASHAADMVCAIDSSRLHVFANRVPVPLQPDEPFVRRCWMRDRAAPLGELGGAIVASGVDAVVIQFHFEFFSPGSFRSLIEGLIARGALVLIVFHATQEPAEADFALLLADIRDVLARVDRLLVHSVDHLNRLKRIGLVNNVTLFPMGTPPVFAGDRAAVRRSLGWSGKTIVATFGHLLPHEGLRELIAAFALLRPAVPGTHLVMLNASHPDPASDCELRACQEAITNFGIQDHVTLRSDFTAESDLQQHLAAADSVVYPFQRAQGSASAAVRVGLSALTPVATTPLPIFSDVADIIRTLPGMAPAEMAAGLAALLARPPDAAARARQRDWVAAHAWPIVSARLDGLITGLFTERRLRRFI